MSSGDGGLLLLGGLGLSPVCPVEVIPVDGHIGMMALDSVDHRWKIEGQRLAGKAGCRCEGSISGVGERGLEAHHASCGSGDGGRVRGGPDGVGFEIPGCVHGGQRSIFGEPISAGIFYPGKCLGSYSIFPVVGEEVINGRKNRDQ